MRYQYQSLKIYLAFAVIAACWAIVAIGGTAVFVNDVTINFDNNNVQFVTGFHASERDELHGRTFRWSNGNATVSLPKLLLGVPSILTLHVLGNYPSGISPVQITLHVDGEPLTAFTVDRDQARYYRLIAPSSVRFDRFLSMRVISDTFSPAGDPRPLGVNLASVSLTPFRSHVTLPSLWIIVCSLVIGVASFTFLNLIGRSLYWALAFSVSVSVLSAIIVWMHPLEVVPFLHRIAAIALLGCLGVGLLRLLVPQTSGSKLYLSGVYLPLAIAIGWWMMPLFQGVMWYDSVPSISLDQPVILIGWSLAGLGCFGSVWYLWYLRTRPALERHHRLARFALALFALAAFSYAISSLWIAYGRQALDFWVWYRGVREWVRGHSSLYLLDEIVQNHFADVFKIPPFFGMLFVPFVGFGYTITLLGFRIISTLLLAATFLIWLRMWHIPLLSLSGIGLFIVFNFRPLLDTIAYGQIDAVLLFLFTLTLWALRSHRDMLAGFLVALGSLLKIYPAFLLLFFVIKRYWQAVLGFIAGVIVLNALSIMVLGWNEHVIFLTQVLPNVGGTTSWIENQTISGFLARLAGSPRDLSVYQNQSIALLGLVISILVILGGSLIAAPKTTRDSTLYSLQYGVFLLLMVLAVPAAWIHYQTILVIPFSVLLLHVRERRIALSYAVIVALSFALVAYGNQWSFYDGNVHTVLTMIGTSYKFFGLLLLGLLLSYEIISSLEFSAGSLYQRWFAQLRWVNLRQ